MDRLWLFLFERTRFTILAGPYGIGWCGHGILSGVRSIHKVNGGTLMARIFVYDSRQFPDPDPKLSVEGVRRQFAEFFPELANAETREETRGEDTVFTFSKRIGTKGKRKNPDSVAIMRRVPEKRLRVFELVAELVDERGEVDVEAAALRQPEVNLALAEVGGYVRATRQATEALAKLPAR